MSPQQYRALAGAAAKPSKYRAKRVTGRDDGLTFDSQAEAAHYDMLRLKLRAGQIIDRITLQPRYDLVVNGVKVATYIADFAYHDGQGRLHVVDVKGVRTPLYKLKRKLVEALYGFTIEEIGQEKKRPPRREPRRPKRSTTEARTCHSRTLKAR